MSGLKNIEKRDFAALSEARASQIDKEFDKLANDKKIDSNRELRDLSNQEKKERKDLINEVKGQEKAEVIDMFLKMNDDDLHKLMKQFEGMRRPLTAGVQSMYHVAVQVLCERCGFTVDNGGIDGIYGIDKNKGTRKAVMDFQKYLNKEFEVGLVEDGLLGPQTLGVILKKWDVVLTRASGEDIIKYKTMIEELSLEKDDSGLFYTHEGEEGIYVQNTTMGGLIYLEEGVGSDIIKYTEDGKEWKEEDGWDEKIDDIIGENTNPYLYAKLLEMSMSGWGTYDKALDAIVSKMNEKGNHSEVFAAYKNLTKSEFLADFKDDVSAEKYRDFITNLMDVNPKEMKRFLLENKSFGFASDLYNKVAEVMEKESVGRDRKQGRHDETT